MIVSVIETIAIGFHLSTPNHLRLHLNLARSIGHPSSLSGTQNHRQSCSSPPQNYSWSPFYCVVLQWKQQTRKLNLKMADLLNDESMINFKIFSQTMAAIRHISYSISNSRQNTWCSRQNAPPKRPDRPIDHSGSSVLLELSWHRFWLKVQRTGSIIQ